MSSFAKFITFTFTKLADGRYLSADDRFVELSGIDPEMLLHSTDAEMAWVAQSVAIRLNDEISLINKMEYATTETRYTTQGWRRFHVVREVVNDDVIYARMIDVTGIDPSRDIYDGIDIENKHIRLGDVQINQKEFYVAKSLYWGWTRKQIAADLHLAEKSIDYYKESLRKKFRAKTMPELMRAINESGLAELLIRKTNWFFAITGILPSVIFASDLVYFTNLLTQGVV